MKGALIDDVALASAVKAGGRIYLGHSALARSIRPYVGILDIWRMIARSAYAQLRFSPLLLAGTTLAMTLVWLVPPLALLFGHGWTRFLGLITWALFAAAYVPTLTRLHRSLFWVLLLPAVALFYMAATIGSAVDFHRGRGVVWKGRAYAEGSPKGTSGGMARGDVMSDMVADAPIDNVEAWSGKTRADENFPVGSRLIGRRVRPHMHAYYNFARNADDIADSPVLPPDEKIERLNIMEAVLLGRRDGGSPSAAALRRSLSETGVRPVHATDLLIAFRQDATMNRYETFDELYNYCRYSAVPVGRYVIDLHGESHDAYGPSDALCISLQILNHLQDCGDDLRTLDRCYIPQTLMRHFSVTTRDLLAPEESPALRRAFITILDRIDRLNLAAEELPYMVRDRRLRAETTFICRLAIRLAERLGRADPLASRVALTKGDFGFSLLRALGTLVWH